MKQEPLIGRTIAGKYEIESLVGQGAMGSVYKARQITLGTTLAIKVLHSQLAREPMFAARFLREAQAASRVDHPSSMRVIDFGEEPDGLLYIAMEYVNGKTLAQILHEEGLLPVTRIVDIACQTLAALAVAHELGVVHRDIKPENIMVIEGQDDEGRRHDLVKVCDFGVAKLLAAGSRAPSVTAEGVAIGTPEYMSPEQAQGEPLDARSDIYAMGVLLFHLMTGKVPFDASTAFGTAFMHVNDEPTRPRLLNPRVDSRLERICLKAMRKRPEDRYASARELRTELRALLGHDDAYADEPLLADGAMAAGGLLQQLEGRPRRTGLVVAGIVLAACAVAAGVLYPRSGEAVAVEPVQSATITSAAIAAPASSPAARVATPEGSEAASAASEPPLTPESAVVTPPPATRARAPSKAPSKASARRSGARTRSGRAAAALDHAPELPEPSASAPAPGLVPAPADKPLAAASATAKPPAADQPAADRPVADKPVAELPAADKPAAELPASDKPAAEKPAAPQQPDPADAPLPVFPIPGVDPTP